MGSGRILLIILSFVGVAVVVLLLGQFGADYVVKGAMASSTNVSAEAPAYAIGWMFTKFVISPIAAIVSGATVAWKIAKSDVAPW
jgi:hypothetical protein